MRKPTQTYEISGLVIHAGPSQDDDERWIRDLPILDAETHLLV